MVITIAALPIDSLFDKRGDLWLKTATHDIGKCSEWGYVILFQDLLT